VMYNYYRQGWIVQRVAAMAAEVFGCQPLVLSLPYQDTLKASEPADFTTIIAGCNQRIPLAFKQRGTFWLNSLPHQNLGVDGFDAALPKSSAPGTWEPIAPTRLIADQASPMQLTTDDWPFLYVKDRLIPDLTIRSMVMLGVLGIAMVALFMPRGSSGSGGLRVNVRMFFLGAAFMLLETKAVVQMALLFGSTWLVNSAVFFSALLLILLANLYVLKVPSARLNLPYTALLVSLAVSVLVPFDTFLNGGIAWRYILPCLLALGPMVFAGIIFARTFRDETHPEHAFGWNIAGSMIGGLAEQFSTLLGFQHLLVLAICFYLLSTWTPALRPRLSPAE